MCAAATVWFLSLRGIIRQGPPYCTPFAPLSVRVLLTTPASRDLTQFLFSYKLNPQTVVILGYSDNSLGARSIDFVRADRTLFFKIGYAWVM